MSFFNITNMSFISNIQASTSKRIDTSDIPTAATTFSCNRYKIKSQCIMHAMVRSMCYRTSKTNL
jgi:hypothetical protein